LQALAAASDIKEVPAFSEQADALLNAIVDNFSEADAERVKDIESQTKKSALATMTRSARWLQI